MSRPGRCGRGGGLPGASPLRVIGSARRRHRTSPSPPCVPPSIFSDCFTGLSGSLSLLIDPPIGGWSVIKQSAAPGANVTFDGDQAVFSTGSLSDLEIAKALAAAPPAGGISLQFKLTQYPTALPSSGVQYAVIVTDAAGDEALSVFIDGTGLDFRVATGPLGMIFNGIWSPSPGATVVVHVQRLPGAGFPAAAWIDQVPVALAPAGPGPDTSGLPASTMALDSVTDEPLSLASSPFDFVFASASIDPPTTIYCCPDGTPAS